MKQFVLTTQSESGDRYMYFIENERFPSKAQIKRFLKVYASDKDDKQVYEQQDQIIEITPIKFNPIPTIEVLKANSL